VGESLACSKTRIAGANRVCLGGLGQSPPCRYEPVKGCSAHVERQLFAKEAFDSAG
jgi:hypothetical protein